MTEEESNQPALTVRELERAFLQEGYTKDAATWKASLLKAGKFAEAAQITPEYTRKPKSDRAELFAAVSRIKERHDLTRFLYETCGLSLSAARECTRTIFAVPDDDPPELSDAAPRKVLGDGSLTAAAAEIKTRIDLKKFLHACGLSVDASRKCVRNMFPNTGMEEEERQRLQDYFGIEQWVEPSPTEPGTIAEINSTLRNNGLSKRLTDRKIYCIKSGQLDEANQIQPAPKIEPPPPAEPIPTVPSARPEVEIGPIPTEASLPEGHLAALGVTLVKTSAPHKLTHRRLTAIVAKRFLLQGWIIKIEVPFGNRRADLVVSKGRYAIAFEIKVSLYDFLKDTIHAEKRRPIQEVCDEFWFVVPAWLPISGAPIGCGLLVCDTEGKLFIRQGVISPAGGVWSS